MSEMMSVYEQAADWALRLDAGELDLAGQAAFEAWLASDASHAEAFRSVGLLWRETDEIADAPALIDIRASALAAMREGNAQRWTIRLTNRWKPLAAVAASLLLIISAAILTLHNRPVSYTTAVGEHRTVMLEDGSKISLDAATKIEVSYSDERRALKLIEGRAKFDVAKDPRRPFTVSAGNRMVVATGTAFSVELIQRQMRVILYEGSVAVLDDGPANRPPRHISLDAKKASAADTLFKPGTLMVAALDTPVARIEPADPTRTLSWEGGQLDFDEEPLALAVGRVNRYAAKPIRIADQETARLPVSGAFNAGDTEGFVDGVKAIYSLTVSDRGDEIVIQAKHGAS